MKTMQVQEEGTGTGFFISSSGGWMVASGNLEGRVTTKDISYLARGTCFLGTTGGKRRSLKLIKY
jgi:hypothetical protein